MTLADGDMVQYDRLKHGSVGDYLVKLDNYVDGLEREIKQSRQRTAKAK